MNTIIQVKNLFFNYGDQLILEDASINIHRGDYLGLIGSNGSAKTTLLKLILGILKPLKGKIYIFGEEINKFNQWEKIGYLPQKATSFNKSFPATVEEILEVKLKISNKKMKKSNKNNSNKINKVLEIVKMGDYKDHLIGQLSGGQQQRVFIAKALINEPELLLLDEPTKGIDLASQKLFYDIITKLNKELKMTIILVSHDIGVVAEKSNRIGCMKNKKIYSSGIDGKGIEEFIKSIYGKDINLINHLY